MRRAGNDAQHLRDRCPMPNNFGQLLLQLRTRGTRRRSALDPRRVFWFGRSCFIFSLPPLGTPGSGPVLRGDGHHNGSSRKSRCLPWGGASQKNGTERPRSAVGHSLPKCHVRVKSGLPPIATEERKSRDVSNVPRVDILQMIPVRRGHWGLYLFGN